MEAVDWPTALANKKRKGLGSFEKRIPTSPIRDQGSYRRGMKRDDAEETLVGIPVGASLRMAKR